MGPLRSYWIQIPLLAGAYLKRFVLTPL
ncbi:hypothetical protein SBDP1_1210002 [Syntrophobacter sp. SbD1]|nr:hypothetical protein SBDP1_1210002 [Syntrophobacter sp. SbD1]